MDNLDKSSRVVQTEAKSMCVKEHISYEEMVASSVYEIIIKFKNL